MSPMLVPVIGHFASGQAFFSGVALMLLACGLGVRPSLRRAAVVISLLGLVLIGLSATPLPWLFYAALLFFSVRWMVRLTRHDDLRRRIATVSLCLFLAIGAALEARFHVMPRLEPRPAERLIVIGDSVTAGIGEGEAITWPQLLVQRHHLEVDDRSFMGATVGSALKAFQACQPEKGLVLLEIGGNDLLGSTTVEDFEKNLAALLEVTTQSHSQAAMFELPLPPLGNRFREIQRRLARQYGVQLIPKRVLTRMILSSDTTLDSIHLNQAGHDRFAAFVWSFLAPVFDRAE